MSRVSLNERRSTSNDLFAQNKTRGIFERKRNSLTPIEAEKIQGFESRRHSLSSNISSTSSFSSSKSTLSRLEMVEQKFFQTRKKKSISTMQRKISVRTSLKSISEKSNNNTKKIPVQRSESLLQLFQRVVKSIRIIWRISQYMRRYAASKNDVRAVSHDRDFLKSFKRESKKRERACESNLCFDKTSFVVDESYKLPYWARMLCGQPPDQRNEDELLKLQRYLRGIPIFSKFPKSTQMELCRNALYGRYDNLRIILSQGHDPEYFYIILSGQVAVNVLSYDRNTGIEIGRSVDQLREHDSFGGTGLIYNTKRTASVIAASKYVEVILFDKDIFNKFCHHQLKKVYEQQKHFLKTHSVFEQWTERKLNVLSYDCKSKYFRQGKIIDFDLARSNFIYFVMEGAADILYYKRDQKPGWLYSDKLKKEVGILGGNKMIPPCVCNLPNSLRTDTNIATTLISCSVTVLYLPVSRYIDIKPKQRLPPALSLDHNEPSIYELDDEKYTREKSRALRWIEYRSQVVNENVKPKSGKSHSGKPHSRSPNSGKPERGKSDDRSFTPSSRN